jgi:uncharacterized protein (TIGR03118 family)
MPRPSPYRPLSVLTLEDRSNPSTAYLATDLIADLPGVAPITDPTLVNAWGISLNSAGGAFWVSANGTDLSEVYTGDVNGSPIGQPFKVSIPGGAPTGQVFNSTTDFPVTAGGVTRPSVFIFASEAGLITGWNPGVPPTTPPPSRVAEVGFAAPDGAVYKGLALAKVGAANFLYAADFHNNKIDVIDGQFHKVTLGTGGFESFTDPNLPEGYAPFNVAAIGGKLYVSYAKQDADAEDDVAGPGRGFVDVFETNGHFDGRLVSRGALNSPWGMVQAPAGFGDFAGALLVGNFGDGRINAYDINTGERLGTLTSSPGHPVVIDGLWGLAFGNGVSAGDAKSLYYAAGPDDEAHGLFGKVTANAAGTNPVTAKLTGDTLTITGSRDDDRVRVRLDNHDSMITVIAGNDRIGQFDAAAVHTIRFTGFAGDDQFRVDDDVTATVIADGGAGNDFLRGGGGNNVLLGGPGSDLLRAGKQRDVLIGGTGRDLLIGRSGDDILIGGSTAHDGNPAALSQILAVWTGSDTYAARVAAIRAGTGGVPKLDATTVIDDGVGDLLVGGQGQDWFLGVSPPDVFAGIRAGEEVN